MTKKLKKTENNKKLNLKNDILFKAFFSRKGNQKFLIDFLNSILKIEITKIAKVIQALICLIIALIHLKIHYNLFKILGILFMILFSFLPKCFNVLFSSAPRNNE